MRQSRLYIEQTCYRCTVLVDLVKVSAAKHTDRLQAGLDRLAGDFSADLARR
jgi:hypothetical protein